MPRIAVIIDTSASVDDTLLGRALGEVQGALRALGVSGESITLLSVDAAVHGITTVRRTGDIRLSGGGGTDLRVGFAALIEMQPRPNVVVVFTDGYTPWPESPPPGAAVIVALLGRSESELPATPEWATRIECVLT